MYNLFASPFIRRLRRRNNARKIMSRLQRVKLDSKFGVLSRAEVKR